MPRPAKKPRPRSGPRAEAAILVRLSDEEHAELRRAAVAADLPLGIWLRRLALAAARVAPRERGDG